MLSVARVGPSPQNARRHRACRGTFPGLVWAVFRDQHTWALRLSRLDRPKNFNRRWVSVSRNYDERLETWRCRVRNQSCFHPWSPSMSCLRHIEAIKLLSIVCSHLCIRISTRFVALKFALRRLCHPQLHACTSYTRFQFAISSASGMLIAST